MMHISDMIGCGVKMKREKYMREYKKIEIYEKYNLKYYLV